MRRGMWLVVILLIPSIFAIWSVHLGKDFNWDLRNYHYYNAYAFLENRLNLDIAPAQLQTFHNPTIDVSFYWMTKHLPSIIVGFIFGVIQGFNVSFVFLLFWKIARISSQKRKFLLGIMVALFGGIAPGFVSELGTTFYDNITSLFALSCVLLLIIASEHFERGEIVTGTVTVIFGGASMGIGVGLKSTTAFYAIAAAFALSVLFRPYRHRISSIGCYGIAVLVGVLLSGGHWFWKLWSHFGNPLLPYYNNIFQSAYIQPGDFMFRHFLPKQIWEYLVWPIIFSVDSKRVAEVEFSDIRFALMYLLLIMWFLRSVFCLRNPQLQAPKIQNGVFRSRPGSFLVLFFVCSFFLWMILFSVYRFLITLELLVPLSFLIVLERTLRFQRTQIAVATGSAVVLLLWFVPPNWGRLPWSDPYFHVDTTRFTSTEKGVVVMLGYAPMAYIMPFFPSNMRFVRPEGNLGLGNKDRFLLEIKGLLGERDYPKYVLFNSDEVPQPEGNLLRCLGFNFQVDDCFELKTNTPDRLRMCRIIEGTDFNLRRSTEVFTDVPSGYWAETYINAIFNAKITVGYAQDDPNTPENERRYCPENNVSREQMAAFIVRAKEGEPASDYCSTGSSFSDVDSNYWSCKYIKRLYELGITTGCAQNPLRYCPDTYVTRGQMAAFIIRAIYGENFSYSQTPYFTDVPATHNFFKYVQKLRDNGITTVTGTYGVDNIVTRDQMAAFLARAFLGMQ